ncbi:MAG: hypothetical protein QTN59_18445 [Candidatus Electrothrix communis]|nr:hypothetical protein [Desulfobulbus sp. US4]WLE96649.1 MAG: hypothetical protein QTN59_18445 [Candidatus Electrothrix communis]
MMSLLCDRFAINYRANSVTNAALRHSQAGRIGGNLPNGRFNLFRYCLVNNLQCVRTKHSRLARDYNFNGMYSSALHAGFDH